MSDIVSGEVLEANLASATLEALITALSVFSGKQKQTVCVVCSCPAVINAINQRFIDKWEANGFMTARNKPVEHANLWRRVYEVARERQIEIISRAPDSTETELFYEMGAEYFLPHSKLSEPA